MAELHHSVDVLLRVFYNLCSVCHRLVSFLLARRYASAGLCDSDVSVCPSVTRRYCA